MADPAPRFSPTTLARRKHIISVTDLRCLRAARRLVVLSPSPHLRKPSHRTSRTDAANSNHGAHRKISYTVSPPSTNPEELQCALKWRVVGSCGVQLREPPCSAEPSSFSSRCRICERTPLRLRALEPIGYATIAWRRSLGGTSCLRLHAVTQLAPGPSANNRSNFSRLINKRLSRSI